MTKNLDIEGLSSIVDSYQLFYVDLWGVVHNGVSLHDKAIKTLKEISKKGKDYVLLTNARIKTKVWRRGAQGGGGMGDVNLPQYGV